MGSTSRTGSGLNARAGGETDLVIFLQLIWNTSKISYSRHLQAIAHNFLCCKFDIFNNK